MENVQSSNTFEVKKEKMTLRGYYRNLPQRSSPRLEFIKRVSEECGVSLATARNWCVYGMKPQKFSHVEKLSKLTGINETDLWED